MSANVYWSPVNASKRVDGNDVTLKNILRNKYGNHFRMDASSLEWLGGIRDAIDYADQQDAVVCLINAIIQFGEIEVSIE